MPKSDSNNEQTLDWNPHKGGRRPSRAAATASSAAASAAIANIENIDRRMSQGFGLDREYLDTISTSPNAGGPKAGGKSAAAAPPSAGRKLVIGGVVAATALVLILSAGGLLGGSVHMVKGVVLLDRKPLSDVEIKFHPVEKADVGPFRARASRAGGFGIEGLPRGSYAVTLHGDPDAGTVVPATYEQPETTPFRLNLQQDLDNISLFVKSRP